MNAANIHEFCKYMENFVIRQFWNKRLRACAHQEKFGGKLARETESEKGHTCIPTEVRTPKAILACVTVGSKAGQIVSRAKPAGSMIPDATKGRCAHLSALNVYTRLILSGVHNISHVWRFHWTHPCNMQNYEWHAWKIHLTWSVKTQRVTMDHAW